LDNNPTGILFIGMLRCKLIDRRCQFSTDTHQVAYWLRHLAGEKEATDFLRKTLFSVPQSSTALSKHINRVKLVDKKNNQILA